MKKSITKEEYNLIENKFKTVEYCERIQSNIEKELKIILKIDNSESIHGANDPSSGTFMQSSGCVLVNNLYDKEGGVDKMLDQLGIKVK